MRLVLATRNAHKVRELSALLAPHELEPLAEGVELPAETGESFAENALAKARTAAAATGIGALGDDSGIEALALGGAPGIRSARFAGEDASDAQNLAELLARVPPEADTRVTYVCALALVLPDGRERVAEGRSEGRLVHEPRGDGGFGYDPAVVPADLDDGRTMAELGPAEKDAISHRGRAARLMLRELAAEEPA